MKNCNLYYLFSVVWCFGVISGCVVSEETDLGIARTSAPLIGAEAPDVIPGEYIVVFEDGATPAAHRSMSEAVADIAAMGEGVRVERTFTSVPAMLARLSDEALERVRRDPAVRLVESNREVSASSVQSNPHPGLDRIDQRRLPLDGSYDDHGFNGSGVHVYVVDTGIRTTHVEFTGRVGGGFSAINDGGGVEDCNGHGTHLASVAAGTQFGVAKGATVHPVRVLSCFGSGTTAGIIAGLDFVQSDCAAHGERCVALTGIGGGPSSTLDAAVANLVAADVPVVVSSGSTDPCSTSPAREPSAITTGRVDGNDARTPASACVDIYAPGTSTGADDGGDKATSTLTGTSMAASFAAGVAAMRLDQRSTLSAAQVAADMFLVATELSDLSGPYPLLYNDFATCQGSCGTQAPGGCWCDDLCEGFGDCCADYAPMCP